MGDWADYEILRAMASDQESDDADAAWWEWALAYDPPAETFDLTQAVYGFPSERADQ